jgi:hypothetical protein
MSTAKTAAHVQEDVTKIKKSALQDSIEEPESNVGQCK